MTEHRRMNDGRVVNRYFRPEVWLPILIAMGMGLGGVVYAGGQISQSVDNNTTRLEHLEENNQELKQSSARVDERTELMQKRQETIEKDIKEILKALRATR